MNIKGIGSDLVEVARIRRLWERYGAAFGRRILSTSEQNDLSICKDPVAFLAKRFAAKEAMAKALGTGFRPSGVLLREISVHHDPMGRPYLICTGGAAQEMQKQNIVASHLSLSDERSFALAFVVLEVVLAREG